MKMQWAQVAHNDFNAILSLQFASKSMFLKHVKYVVMNENSQCPWKNTQFNVKIDSKHNDWWSTESLERHGLNPAVV